MPTKEATKVSNKGAAGAPKYTAFITLQMLMFHSAVQCFKNKKERKRFELEFLWIQQIICFNVNKKVLIKCNFSFSSLNILHIIIALRKCIFSTKALRFAGITTNPSPQFLKAKRTNVICNKCKCLQF